MAKLEMCSICRAGLQHNLLDSEVYTELHQSTRGILRPLPTLSFQMTCQKLNVMGRAYAQADSHTYGGLPLQHGNMLIALGPLQGTVLMALLQPAPEVYDLFDDILLLCEGEPLYSYQSRLEAIHMSNDSLPGPLRTCACLRTLAAPSVGTYL